MSLLKNRHLPGSISDRNVVFSSPLLEIGLFRCPTWSPSFQDSGPAQRHLLVFPRTSVKIQHEGKRPVVADPNVVMLYNQGQIYSRTKLSDRGDLCDWFSYHPKVIVEAMRPFDPTVDERWNNPFCFTHGPTDSDTYLLQRLAFEHVCQTLSPDVLFVEETMLLVLERVLRNTYHLNKSLPVTRPDTRQAHADLVHAAKAFIATHFNEPLTIDEIAQATYSSAFHLCRVFRQYTGNTLHHYLNQVRLKASLEFVAEPDVSLTDIGIGLGYASHSHFTKAFRQTFGAPPSTLRERVTIGRIREMSKILTA
ncbi:MAG: AraC family transcriptional regulator [Candidatus Promineifilaceae bacterium]